MGNTLVGSGSAIQRCMSNQRQEKQPAGSLGAGVVTRCSECNSGTGWGSMGSSSGSNSASGALLATGIWHSRLRGLSSLVPQPLAQHMQRSRCLPSLTFKRNMPEYYCCYLVYWQKKGFTDYHVACLGWPAVHSRIFNRSPTSSSHL